jgi:IMP dehydrogenase
MREALTFNDVLIVPQYSKVRSRRDVSLSTTLAGIDFSLPIVSANMQSVTESALARRLSELGGLPILHRFMGIDDNVRMYQASTVNNAHGDRVAISIGISEKERERAEALYEVGARLICVDVAHGAQERTVDQVVWLRENLPEYKIIVGNFAGAGSVHDFATSVVSRGVALPDVIKIGVGPGAACSTRIKTGVGYPQLSAVMECRKAVDEWKGVQLIADGGCREPGDIAKALAAGADMVMVGFMFAGTDEAPGDVQSGGVKVYAGSASGGYADGWRTSEGVKMTVPLKGPLAPILADIEGGVRSSLTYVGARNLQEFRENVEFVRITSATLVENRPVNK